MNTLIDTLISYPGQSMVVTSTLVLIVDVLSIVRVVSLDRAERRRRQRAKAARFQCASGTAAARRRPALDQTLVEAPYAFVRPDDMTAVYYPPTPVELWGGRRA